LRLCECRNDSLVFREVNVVLAVAAIATEASQERCGLVVLLNCVLDVAAFGDNGVNLSDLFYGLFLLLASLGLLCLLARSFLNSLLLDGCRCSLGLLALLRFRSLCFRGLLLGCLLLRLNHVKVKHTLVFAIGLWDRLGLLLSLGGLCGLSGRLVVGHEVCGLLAR
jgi:hypothetical protein